MEEGRIKIGFQTQFDSKEGLLYNRVVLPAAWMAINVVKADWLEEMVAVNPGARRIFRHHPNRPWADDPERQAVEAVAHIGQMMAGVGHFFTHVTDNNEFILGPDHVSRDLIARADRYISTFIPTAWAELGMGTCWGNFNVGHWGGGPQGGQEIIDYFPLSLAAAQQDKDSPICFHDYNWRTLRDDSLSYVGRWVRAMPAILERYPGVKCMVTELGIDRPSREWGADHEGYRMAFDDPAQAVEMFCGDQGLRWINDLANQYDWMLALLLFGCGMVDPWRPQGFDIMNHENDVAVLDRIKQFPVVPPPEPPPPEPPNGGDNVIRVFDLENKELFGEEALDRIAFHGITVHQPVGLRLGEWYWDVVRMREAMHAGFIYTGLKEDGSVAAGQEAAWAWADDMGDADDILGDNYPTDWQLQADLGHLNDEGNMGPAYGQKGWFKNPYEPGPGRAWIRDPLRWSVKLTGMGMLNMTNHHTMFATWQLKQWAGEDPTPPNGDLLEVARGIRAYAADGVSLLADIKAILLKKPPEPPPPPPPPPEIFKGQYFNNITLSGAPVLLRDDPAINFNWGSGSPGPGVNADDFSVRWTGTFTFEAGAYRFKVRADDGVRLYVDGVRIIDAWKDQGPTDYEATVTLSAGLHPIGLDYYERGGGAVISLIREKVG